MPHSAGRWIKRWLTSRSDAAVTAAAAGLLLLAGVVAFASFQNYGLAVEHQAQRAMRARAESRRTEIELFLQSRRADAAILAARLEALPARRPGVPGFLDPGAAPLVDRIFHQTAGSYRYRDIRLLDAHDATVHALADDDVEPVEVAAFHAALSTGRQAFVDVHSSPRDSAAFGFVQPLFDDASPTPVGVVYLELNVEDSLAPVIAQRPGAQSTEESLLVRVENGELHYLTPRHLATSRTVTPPPGARPLAWQIARIVVPTDVVGPDYRGELVVGAAAPINRTSWFVLTKADEAEIEAPVAAIRLAVLSIMGVLTTFLVIGARLIWRARQADLLAARLVADERYRTAIDVSIDGYLVTDDHGVVLEANNALLRMLGYAREEFVGRRIQDVQARVTTTSWDEELAAFRAAGTVRLQTIWHRADGAGIDLAVSLMYVATPDGGTFHAFAHDIGPELAARRRIERLNAFYLFLSHANAAIFNLRDPQEILDAVCHAAVRDGGFVLVWAGFLEAAGSIIRPTSAHGEAANYVRTLEITTDPVLPTSRGPTRECLHERRIVSVGDFQNDPSTEPWHEKGRRYGIQSSAAVPIIVGGEPVAALTFYSRERHYFDGELKALLEETARNVSLALQAVVAERDRARAEDARRASDERFLRVFESSPFPMQIFSREDLTMRAANRASERMFGYTVAEIASPTQWGRTVYPDPEYCKAVLSKFARDVKHAASAGPGTVLESPEISVRCKSGAVRVMRSYLTVVADEVLLQWLDLTEIKRQQADLVEGERRFRGMIEQTVSGVFVAAGGRVVYANPRLIEMLGYSHSELIGMRPFDFVDEADRAEAQRMSERLRQASSGVSGSLRVTRRDGVQIVVGLHATLGSWDGAPANIVMVEDITESKRAEAKIAAYVARLEGTMRGTLQAVANMVDLRDPYTSGHERRVGIIAADIARELGWTEEACEHLKLIGLVHDIGKIAIPAEILSKPAKLTALEYSLIKSHAEKGFEILKDVDFPVPIAEIIRQHHERMDGSGYPLGLTGDRIRPEARIIAVADVIEAMASHRPYRPSLGIAAALAEIEARRGTWFDPHVVDAALRLVREKGYTLPV